VSTYGPACDTPVRRAALLNRWEEVTFLHWRYEPEAVQRLLPPGLEVDTCEGAAWVGLVLFRMRIGLLGLPPVPWLLTFPETNVRTYVRMHDGAAGVWFFSLDAARLAPVLVGRSTYRLRYCWSAMSITRSGATISYTTHRRLPGPRGALSEGLSHLPEMVAAARKVNARLLTIQRAGQGCAVSTALFERVALPSLEEGQRTGALRFGDPRTMAMVGALCIAINAVAGFTNRSLRAQVAGFLASNYTVADDLRPPTPETQRPDPARSTFQHVCAHLRRRTGGHLFTPRSTSAYCAHCSPLIIPPQ